MVKADDGFLGHWGRDRERREIEALEQLALALLLIHRRAGARRSNAARACSRTTRPRAVFRTSAETGRYPGRHR